MRRFGAFVPMFAWAGVAIKAMAAMVEKNFIVFIQWIDLGSCRLKTNGAQQALSSK